MQKNPLPSAMIDAGILWPAGGILQLHASHNVRTCRSAGTVPLLHPFVWRATSGPVHVAVREAVVRQAALKDALSFLEDVNSIIASSLQSAILRVKAQQNL